MSIARRLTHLIIVLALVLGTDTIWAQTGSSAKAEPYLAISYGLALGRCSGALVLHPDGRFKASAYFRDEVHERSGKTDPVYWDLAVKTLRNHRVKAISSIDAYYHTVPDDAPDAKARMAALEAETDYIILDGHAYRLDWRDEDGDRSYLYDAHSRSGSRAMWKELLRVVRFEKMTCGHYMQQLFFPE